VVLKVVDIDPQGSIESSKGSINSHGPTVITIFSDCVLFYHAFQVKSTQIYFDTYFPCFSNCWVKAIGGGTGGPHGPTPPTFKCRILSK